MKRKLFSIFGIGLVVFFGPTKIHAALSGQDKTFILHAATSGMTEVEWSRLAARKGASADPLGRGDTRVLADRIIRDVSKLNGELNTLAKKKGFVLKTEEINPQWRSDQNYSELMVRILGQHLSDFQEELRLGSDPDVKEWAKSNLEGIRRALKLATSIDAEIIRPGERVI